MNISALSQKMNLKWWKKNSWTIILLLILPFTLINLSCSKKNNDKPQSQTTSGCALISWTNTLGDSGYFQGSYVTPSKFELVAEHHYDGITASSIYLHYDVNDHIVNDHPGYTVTYNNDNIVKIDYTDETTDWIMNFNSLGQLTTISASGTDNGDQVDASYTYTYDNNGDPVKIVIHYNSTSVQGTDSWVYTITGTYLTNHGNFLPNEPDLAPFTVYFAFTTFISKHLIDKWAIHGEGALADGTTTVLDFTRQYTYTFDNSGNVTTMVHTGNPDNIYTFNYSQCQ